MLHYTEVDAEILYTRDVITKIDQTDIECLKSRASNNKRKRIRLCAHPGVDDSLHEMLIVHHRGNYVPPHRHPGKSESFHIIEGELKVVLFSDEGSIRDVIRLDSVASKGGFLYYRLSESLYHTVIPVSNVVVFHETTNGPFCREDMVIPDWAPEDDAGNNTINAFMTILNERISKWKNQ